MKQFFFVFSPMMKIELPKHLTKKIDENDFFSIGSFIYLKTQAEMCYKWIQLGQHLGGGTGAR